MCLIIGVRGPNIKGQGPNFRARGPPLIIRGPPFLHDTAHKKVVEELSLVSGQRNRESMLINTLWKLGKGEGEEEEGREGKESEGGKGRKGEEKGQGQKNIFS